MALDSIDVKILEVLQNNSRVSISELSKQVNLSLSAVSERLKKLENSDIIKCCTTIIDPVQMGKSLSVIMQVSLENTSAVQNKELFDFIDAQDDVLECHHVTGEYDYALFVCTQDTGSLESLMSAIKSFPTVRHCQTSVILSTRKKKYSVSPVATK